MKRKAIPLFLTITLLGTIVTGCQSATKQADQKTTEAKTVPMSESDKYIIDEDGCNNYLYDGETAAIVQDRNGYYFKRDGLLCYYDKNADKSVVVCSKPDCKHELNDKTCDANLVKYGDELFLYKNQLYTTHLVDNDEGVLGIYLTQISSDGTSRKDLFRFQKVIDENSDGEYASYHIYIHRGYLYYCIDNQDGSKKQKVRLYRRALVKDAPEEVFYETEVYGGSISCIRGYGNEIYFHESGFRKPEKEEYMDLMKCNIHTKKSELVKKDFYGYYEKNADNIYFFDKEKKKLVRYSEKTKEVKELCSVEQMPETDLKSDGQYLYLYCFAWKKNRKHGVNRVQVLDMDGNTVAVLEDTGEFIGADENLLFFKHYESDTSDSTNEEEEQNDVTNYYYYKKSDLGSGDYSKRRVMLPE